jgi:predicted nucleic acid-binding protein
MKIIINDANILIDLVKLELIDVFSELNFDLHTTDFVYEEIYDDQKRVISNLNKREKLKIIETSSNEDFLGINNLLQNSKGLSFEDCSVWYYAKKLSGILLTGDNQLRRQATKNFVEVRGIIYVFDELVFQKLISLEVACIKIEELAKLNDRLPKKEIEKRILLWKK